MKILIIGSNGYIGSNIAKELEANKQSVVRADIAESKSESYYCIDIRNELAVHALMKEAAPDIVFHLAGLSSLDKCEQDKELAYAINVTGTFNIVSAIKAVNENCKLVFMSSDYVFDGTVGNYTEQSEKRPVTQYGITKALAEDCVLTLPNSIVCRTSNVFGQGGNFYNFLIGKISRHEEVEVFCDTIYTPTYVSYLVDSIIKLANSKFTGIIHLAGADVISRFDFANALASTYHKGKEELIIKSLRGPASLIATNSSLNTSLAKSMNYQAPNISHCILYALNILKYPYFSFTDIRGKIVGISNKIPLLQMNLCESKQGCVRGNHYHRIARELFYIIQGRVHVTLQNEFCREFDIFPGDILQVEPFCTHTFEALDDSCWINALTTDSTTGDIERN